MSGVAVLCFNFLSFTLGLEVLFMGPKVEFFWDFHSRNLKERCSTPKGHTLAWNCVFELSLVQIRRTV